MCAIELSAAVIRQKLEQQAECREKMNRLTRRSSGRDGSSPQGQWVLRFVYRRAQPFTLQVRSASALGAMKAMCAEAQTCIDAF